MNHIVLLVEAEGNALADCADEGQHDRVLRAFGGDVEYEVELDAVLAFVHEVENVAAAASLDVSAFSVNLERLERHGGGDEVNGLPSVPASADDHLQLDDGELAADCDFVCGMGDGGDVWCGLQTGGEDAEGKDCNETVADSVACATIFRQCHGPSPIKLRLRS